MWSHVTPFIAMKKQRPNVRSAAEPGPAILRDAPAMRAPLCAQEVVSVRTAKATLSALLDLVATGREVLINSDGRPKARLVAPSAAPPRKVFSGSAAHLAQMPPWRGGLTADETIRADRDSRGW